jgi:hypothetical protein
VVEIIPPTVDTQGARDVGATGGLDVDIYTRDVVSQILQGVNEIAYGEDGANIIRGSRDQLDALFKAWNGVN